MIITEKDSVGSTHTILTTSEIFSPNIWNTCGVFGGPEPYAMTVKVPCNVESQFDKEVCYDTGLFESALGFSAAWCGKGCDGDVADNAYQIYL